MSLSPVLDEGGLAVGLLPLLHLLSWPAAAYYLGKLLAEKTQRMLDVDPARQRGGPHLMVHAQLDTLDTLCSRTSNLEYN